MLLNGKALGGQTMETAETFGVSRRWRAVLFAMIMVPGLALMVFAVWSSIPFTLGVLIAGQTIVCGLLMWLIAVNSQTMTITEHGLTLYRIWKLRWQDVVVARRYRVFGRSYLRVVRSGKWPANLWLPLYLVGRRPLIIALYERTPPSNPIHQSLESIATKARTESGAT